MQHINHMLKPNNTVYVRLIMLLLSCVLVVSCTRWPEPVPVTSAQWAMIKTAALHVQAPEGHVVYSRHSFPGPPTGTLLDVVMLPFLVADALIDAAKDYDRTQDMQKTLEAIDCTQPLVDYFINQIKQAGLFERIERVNEVDETFLRSNSYDGLIELDIQEIYLRKTDKAAVRLYIAVVGRMRQVAKKLYRWEWTETYVSPQGHPLKNYLAEDGKLLRQDIDVALQHIASRLANSMIYPGISR